MWIEGKDKDDEELDDKESKSGAVVEEDEEEGKDDEERLAKGDEGDDDAEARRQRNREAREKKKRARQRLYDENQKKDKIIDGLQKALAEQNTRLARLEQGNVDQEGIAIDRAIAGAQRHLEAAKADLKRGMAENDPDLVVSANERIAKITVDQREISGMKEAHDRRLKEKTEKRDDPEAGKTEASERVNIAKDPTALNNGRVFLGRHPWFDPQGDDKDSKMVRLIDQSVSDDGFDPRTKEYWEELEDRIQDHLPHRVKKQEAAPSEDTDDEEEEKLPVTTGGKGNGKRDGKVNGLPSLSKERVEALKEAGMWGDPAQRKKMIKRYAAYDKLHGKGA